MTLAELESWREIVLQRDVFLFWIVGLVAITWLLFDAYTARLENVIRGCPQCRSKTGITPSSQPPTKKDGA